MSLLHYISHPEVVIDSEVPVPRWSLSDLGRRRAEAMVGASWVSSITRIVSSDETKALETAGLLAERLGLEVEVRPATGEIDRRATGFLPPDAYHEVSDRFFAEPTDSASGWERAVDGQRRIIDALGDLLTEQPGPAVASDMAVVGHGGVGTLLLCHLEGIPIAAEHDQPHPGHRWTLDRSTGRIVDRWRPIDG